MFLDNLHLMQGWIPRLERKLEIAAESAHPGFQCFFSAEPINGAPQVGYGVAGCGEGACQGWWLFAKQPGSFASNTL